MTFITFVTSYYISAFNNIRLDQIKERPNLPFSKKDDNWINESFVASNFIVVLPQQLR